MSVLITDPNNEARVKRIYGLIPEGIPPLARSVGHMVLSAESRKAVMKMPRSLHKKRGFEAVMQGMTVEWARCFGQATFDIAISASPRPAYLETALLAAMPSGATALCTFAGKLPGRLVDRFDVALPDLSALSHWIRTQSTSNVHS